MKLRKHAVALAALAVYHFVFFFPVFFMGRCISPNDVFFNYDPWSLYRHAATQNSLLHDPPTSYYTLMALARHERAAFHWNPYIASGIPGWGSSAAAILSPFVLLPLFSLPLVWVYTAIVFLKLNAAFLFAYLWLREERLGRGGAAIGALVIAAAGVISVRWLWQSTNATPLYPALLWLIARLFHGKRNSIAGMIAVAIAYALAGFPAAMAYGAYVAVAYAMFLAIRTKTLPWRGLAAGAIAATVALLIAMPSLVPFAQLVRRTGYLETRERVSSMAGFPLHHARLFLFPDALGSSAAKNWAGDPSLHALNNYYEATIYVGVLTLVLALFGVFARRASSRWFWLATLVVILAAIFGFAPFLGRLPGLKYSLLTRLMIVLPLPFGYLAAAGVSLLRRHRITTIAAMLLAVILAGDLGLFAGRFYPYLEPRDAKPPLTPLLAFLRAQPRPFRIAPMMNYFWPNSAELFGIEDVRSHFSSEAAYRAMLQRIDPTAWGGAATVLQFDSRYFNFTDPLVQMLGIRYVVEHKAIDIIKWKIFEKTKPAVAESGAFTLPDGGSARRVIAIGPPPFYAIELPVTVTSATAPRPRLTVHVTKAGHVLYTRDFTPDDIAAMSKIYVPVVPFARAGEQVEIAISARGMKVRMGGAADGNFYFARVETPLIFDRELPDGRIFRNVAEVPRFHAVTRLRKMADEEMLARTDFDFSSEAVVPPETSLAEVQSAASVQLVRYADARQEVRVSGSAPSFLASSEKLTPELRVAIDGKPVPVVRTNILFSGVSVPAGTHTVIFERRIARGWWPVSLLGVLAFVAIGVTEVRRRG